MEKQVWRKAEKAIYQPQKTPATLEIAPQKFLILNNTGNPNRLAFADEIGALYALSYGIKMTNKKRQLAADYVVYPLEALWTSPKPKEYGAINKDELRYRLMIRQPDFVTADYFAEILATVSRKKPNDLYQKVTFETLTDGPCVQMLHVGSYDSEAASFIEMQHYLKENQLHQRFLGAYHHREIYLSDARKTAPEKQKTILRIGVTHDKSAN